MPDLMRRLLGLCAADFGLLFDGVDFRILFLFWQQCSGRGKGWNGIAAPLSIAALSQLLNDLELRHGYGKGVK